MAFFRKSDLVLIILGAVFTAFLVLALQYVLGYFEDKGVLTITSSPSGVLVAINDVPVGVTPLIYEPEKAGSYKFVFTSQGYTSKSVTRMCSGESSLHVELSPNLFGTLDVFTSPSGAVIFVDGVERGSSPISISLDKGEHNLSLLKENMTEVSRVVSIEIGKVTRVDETFVPMVETYYSRIIEVEPDNLQHYCDYMRYLFVNNRYDELTGLMIAGSKELDRQRSEYNKLSTTQKKLYGDHKSRFEQECGKVIAEKGDVYLRLMYPSLKEYILAECEVYPAYTSAIECFLLNGHGLSSSKSKELAMTEFFALSRQYPEKTPFWLLMESRAVIDRLAKSFSSEDRKRYTKLLLESIPQCKSNVRAFNILSNTGRVMVSNRLRNEALELFSAAFEKPVVGVKEAEYVNAGELYMSCFNSLGRMEKGLQTAQELLKKKGVSAKFKENMRKWVKAFERKLKLSQKVKK